MTYQIDINEIAKLMIAEHQTIAVAESVTSGHLQVALSLADNASQFFQGGITVYNVGQKCRHLKIEPIHAISCNCISAKVAEEMAINVSRLFSSHWGIGVTGYATPVNSNDELFAFYALAFNGEIVHSGKMHSDRDDAINVQQFYVEETLRSLLQIQRKNS